MKLLKRFGVSLMVMAVVVAGITAVRAESTPKIPGAGPGGSSASESVIEGTLDKYDSTLNKLTIKGIESDKMTLDAIPSLKAKDGTRRIPMAMIKQGQKIRVIYAEKNKKKIAKDVELVRDDDEEPTQTPKKDKEKEEKGEAKIPGVP
jgi:hypothetical protein